MQLNCVKSNSPPCNLCVFRRGKLRGKLLRVREFYGNSISFVFVQEHQLEAHAHDYLHQTHSAGRSRSPSPVRAKWGSSLPRNDKGKGTQEKTGDDVGVQNEGFTGDDSKPTAETESRKSSNSR